jgi:SAM-dependent methyltransferase
MNFDVKGYWDKRLSGSFSLDGVGSLGMGEYFNRYVYKMKRRTLNKIIRQLHLSLEKRSILDVGSGTGFWIDYYLKRGVRCVHGCDISSVAIRNLKVLYNDFRNVFISETDFGSKLIPFDMEFDIVNAMDVAYHIVNDNHFNDFLSNISKSLHPGGFVFLTDAFLEKPINVPYAHVKYRTLNEYKEKFARNNIKILSLLPMYFFLNPPIDENALAVLMKLIYSNITKPLSKTCVGFFYVPIIYIFDSILTNFQLGISLKLLVGRKA